MNYLKLSVLFVCFNIGNVVAQKHKQCTVTTNADVQIHGYVKGFKWPNNILIRNGFKLYKSKKQKIRIKPAMYKSAQIDTILFKSFVNQYGKYSFMKVLVEENKSSLYVDTYSMGTVTERWTVNDFYLKRGENWEYMAVKKVIKNPEYYFPDAPLLCSTIRETKYKDVQILNWVLTYNKL